MTLVWLRCLRVSTHVLWQGRSDGKLVSPARDNQVIAANNEFNPKKVLGSCRINAVHWIYSSSYNRSDLRKLNTVLENHVARLIHAVTVLGLARFDSEAI